MKQVIRALSFVALAFSAGQAGAVSIVNGSFEAPGTFNGSFQNLPGGSSALTGWAIGGGGIDLIKTYWVASDGDYSLDMSGGSAGSISQTVSGLTVGESYRILFDIAGNPASGNAVKTLKASMGMAGGGTFLFDVTGKSHANMGWTEESFDFVAGATSGLLSFTSMDANAYGPALDNVRIEKLAAVPVPAGGLLLLTGLGGLALRRKKR